MKSRLLCVAAIMLFCLATPDNASSLSMTCSGIELMSPDGAKPDAKDVVRSGELIVWPKRVTNTLNISGLPYGTLVEITTASGVLFKKAVAGSDGFLQIDMTDAEPGVYIVKAGEQQVKIFKR